MTREKGAGIMTEIIVALIAALAVIGAAAIPLFQGGKHKRALESVDTTTQRVLTEILTLHGKVDKVDEKVDNHLNDSYRHLY